MMSKLVAVLCLVLLLPAPVHAAPDTSVTIDTYRATLVELISLLQQQITVLQQQVLSQQSTAPVDRGGFLRDSVRVRAQYTLDRDPVVLPAHQRYLSRVRTIFPEVYYEQIATFLVFDSSESIAAFVEIAPTATSWTYGIRTDAVEDVVSLESTELIVHELGHMVSYDEVVGVPVPGTATCHRYFERYGCPKENSFLEQFIHVFWSVDELDRVAEGSIVALSQYYESHLSQYVSVYAANAPEEDFAETFVWFVFGYVPEGTEAQEKIAFFKRYPELRALREQLQLVR